MRAWLLRIPLLAMTAVMAMWVLEGLFAHDQAQSVLPLRDIDGGAGYVWPLIAGILWPLLVASPGGDLATGRRGMMFDYPDQVPARIRRRRTEYDAATVISCDATSTSIRTVRLYDVYVRVEPDEGEPFLAVARRVIQDYDLPRFREGRRVVVRRRPGERDLVDLAEPDDPRARQVRARRARGPAGRGFGVVDEVQVPASVLGVRPDGDARRGLVPLEVAVLVLPEAGASWETTAHVELAEEDAGALLVGAPVTVSYPPGHPERITLLPDDPPPVDALSDDALPTGGV